MVETEMTKGEAWHTIEGRHFGQCFWQERSKNNKGLLEGLVHKASGRIMIVQKFYETKLPRDDASSSLPWPELESVNIFAPLEDDGTWDGLEAALKAFGQTKTREDLETLGVIPAPPSTMLEVKRAKRPQRIYESLQEAEDHLRACDYAPNPDGTWTDLSGLLEASVHDVDGTAQCRIEYRA